MLCFQTRALDALYSSITQRNIELYRHLEADTAMVQGMKVLFKPVPVSGMAHSMLAWTGRTQQGLQHHRD